MHRRSTATKLSSNVPLRLGLTLGLSIDLLALLIALPSQAETPHWVTPIAAIPVAQTPAAPKSVAQTPIVQTPIIQPSIVPTVIETPIIETPIVETPTVKTPSIETPIAASSGPIEILSPKPNDLLDIASATVTLRYPIGTTIDLKVNGTSVSSSLIGRTETDKKTGQVTQTWYGVTMTSGDNQITADVPGLPQAKTRVTVRGTIAKLSLSTAETRVPADGRSTITISGTLLDDRNNRSNSDALVTLKPSAGEFVEPDADSAQPGYQVQARNGEFRASLRSTSEAQSVRIQAKIGSLDAFTQIQFETSLRPSIATGVVDLRFGKRGLDYRGSFRDFLPADRSSGSKSGYELSSSGAVFATGKVGGWLLTGALNTDRPLNKTCDGANSLFRSVQFCEQAYPVVGDSSNREVLTPSTDRLYLKLERSTAFGHDYAMWGDYNTEEFATASQQFTATSRALHGFKANANLGNLQLSGLYATNIQGFQRDSLAPDGTSGTYILSRRLILNGSENLTLELEELNRPGTVLDRKSLNRGQDYDIDYDRGTINFRQPILRTELNEAGEILLRKIVVTYQYDNANSDGQSGGKNDANLIAARARYHISKLAGRESWIGASYLRERQGDRQFQLYGADGLITFAKGSVIAEYARSSNSADLVNATGAVSGSAYRVEAQYQPTKATQLRAYYRHTDPGFANNATISFVPGQTRYGATASTALSPNTQLRLQYDHEDNQGVAPRPLEITEDGILAPPGSATKLGLDNSLTTISAGLQQKLGQSSVTADYIHRDRTDRVNPGNSSRSDQLRTNLTVPLSSKLTFTALNETTLSASTDALYGDRTALALNWALLPGINLQAGQQFFGRGANSGQSVSNIGLNGEYKLGSDTTLKARYGIVGGVNSWTTQGAIGLNQGWTIAPGLRADLTYEHLFGGFFGQTAAGGRTSQPFTRGQTASSIGFAGGDSYSLGLDYTGSPTLQANMRYEHRSSSSGSNTVFNGGITGKLSPAITALVRYQQSGTSNQQLQGLGDSRSLKVGLAYRNPNSDKFNALLRYEYRNSPSIAPNSILLGSGSGSIEQVIAAEAIYAPNAKWELYSKFALRNSRTFLSEDLAGASTLTLAQLRATYHLNYSWDLVGEARWIGQPSLGYSETGAMVEAGYYLTPNLRLAAGYTFGKVSDRDFDGSRSEGGFHVGLTVKLTDLIDGFGRQKPVAKPVTTVPAPVPKL
jgi:hypothetical protein